MARPVGHGLRDDARLQDYAIHGAQVQTGVFGGPVRISGEFRVGVQLLDGNLHGSETL